MTGSPGGGGAGAGAAAAGGASALGGRGTSTRNATDPMLWTIGSPSLVTTTTQNRFWWFPAGVVASVLMWKRISGVSWVIRFTSVSALFGSPTSVTVASPGKSACLATLTTMSVSFPCSTAAFW